MPRTAREAGSGTAAGATSNRASKLVAVPALATSVMTSVSENRRPDVPYPVDSPENAVCPILGAEKVAVLIRVDVPKALLWASMYVL